MAADVERRAGDVPNRAWGRPSHRSESKIQAIRALLDQAGNRAPIEGTAWMPPTPLAHQCRGLDPGRRQRDLLEPGPGTRELRAAAAAAIAALTVPSSVTHRVRYAETDKMGVVYYANYLVWFEVARADLLRSLAGPTRKWKPRESCCRSSKRTAHQRPARYDDEIEVRTQR